MEAGRGSALRRVLGTGALLLGLLLAGRPATALAQRIDITVTPVEVIFPAPSLADFDQGWVDAPVVNVMVDAKNPNRRWDLTLHSTSANLGGWGKPLGALQYRSSPTEAWRPMSADPAVLHIGRQQLVVVPIYFRMLLSPGQDAPGTYGATAVFTVVQY